MGDDVGTVARICTRGGGSGFFRMAAPLLSGMVQRSIAKDLSSLRDMLESPPG